MASKRNGLGRGLGALFGDKANISPDRTDVVREISVEEIHPNPYQPRQVFDPQAMNELADSIKNYGILQPVIVRKIDEGNYELIAGERRLRAAKMVGLEKIPAIVRKYTDQEISEIALIENLQRQNLNVIEEAQAYQRLIAEFGYTQDKLAKKIGVSRSQITNTIRLLKLAPPLRELVAKGKLSPGQARPLLALETEELQMRAAEMVLQENLTSKMVETFMREFKKTINLSENEVKEILSDAPTKKITKNVSEQEVTPAVEENISAEKIPEAPDNIPEQVTSSEVDLPHENYVRLAENKLTELLNVPVKIVSDAKSNQIQITFLDDTQLLQIIRNLDRHIGGTEISGLEDETILPNTREEKIAALRKFSTEGTF